MCQGVSPKQFTLPKRKQIMKLHLPAAVAGLLLVLPFASNVSAAGHQSGMQRSSSPAIRTDARTSFQSRLIASPGVVQVGRQVTLSVIAPIPSSVRVSFRSLHHAFSGMARYQASTRTYVVSVRLLIKMHGTERAVATAVVTPRATGRTYQLTSQFLIQGQSTGTGMGMGMGRIPQHNGGDADSDNIGAPTDGDGDR
jgi:hypothetical protein